MKTWIRGVNLGGWLVLERFITPYLFAITSCHLEGNFCYYPGQAGGAMNDELLCRDMKACEAVLQKNPVTGKQDYPWDEYSLMQAFDKSPLAGKEYLRKHYDTFVTRDDIAALHQAGVTHVRVPLPHWIQLNETEASPYVPDDAWLYFLRLIDWCRKYKIQVWADLHTAPGSQNGFDNSGRLSTVKTCSEWNENATLSALQSILVAMHNDDLQDVVTGIGVLNEPWKDCHNIREYNRKALQLVRQTLGNTTSVIIGDTFNATLWNDGYWENEPHTYLDSHYYHVFAENMRALSPKQHIALVCRKNARDTNECCHEGAASGEKPASGISRLVSEWSAAYDTEPNELLKEVMAGILETGEAPRLHRNLTQGERDFVKQFCKAQMVVYESNATGVSSGWFYWNFKMEGGAFAEWDFLRGVREGWIPTLPAQNVSSVSKFGTCEQILYETVNDKTIIHEYPDPNKVDTWKGDPLDDDLVISMGKTDSEENGGESSSPTKEEKETTGEKAFSGYADDDDDDNVPDSPPTDDDGYNTSGKAPAEKKKKKKGHAFFTLVVLGFFAYGIKRVFFSEREVPPWRARDGYSSIHGSSTGEAVTMAV